MQTALRKKTEMGNEKDPSAALGMTVLGERIDSQGRCAAFLEEGILVSQPSPLGEGAPRGRIG